MYHFHETRKGREILENGGGRDKTCFIKQASNPCYSNRIEQAVESAEKYAAVFHLTNRLLLADIRLFFSLFLLLIVR